MSWLLIVIGVLLLFGGGEALLRGAVALARRTGLSKMLIGMTVVAFGTSAPELVVAVSASLRGVSGIAVGNVVGSNIANVLLIIGAAALVAPIVVRPADVRRDSLLMVAASVAVCALALSGGIGRVAGGVLLAALIASIGWAYRVERGTAAEETRCEEVDVVSPPRASLVLELGSVLLGLAALTGGAQALVSGATAIARGFGVSEVVIGLTIVAVGTSLPELATSLTAARHGHGDVAVANVIGSNLFNALGILGAAALVHPLVIERAVALRDVWIMLGAAIALAALLLRGRLGRGVGTAFLAAYVGYLGLLAFAR